MVVPEIGVTATVGLLAVETAVALGLALLLVRSREQTGAVPLAGVMLALSVLTGSSAVFRVLMGDLSELVAILVFFPPFFLFAPLWMWFVVTYTRAVWLSPARLIGLAIPGLVGTGQVGYWTLSELPATPFSTASPSFVLFVLPVLFSYALIIGGAAVLVYAGRTYASVSRSRTALFAGGTLSVAILNPIMGLEQVMALSLSLFAVGIRRGDLHAVAAAEAIGRKSVVEQLSEAVIVLDTHGCVVDMNESAAALLGTSLDDAIEDSLVALLDGIEVIGGETPDAIDGVVVRGDSGRRHYEVTSSPIVDRTEEVVGQALVFRDVTDREAREQRLQVLNRILRHNLRNELQIVRTRNELLAADLDGEHGEQAAASVSTIDDLIALSDKARSVESMIDQRQASESFDLTTTLTGLLDQYRADYPAVDFSFDGPASYRIEGLGSLELAFENLIENAAEHGSASPRSQAPENAVEHNTADSPTVDVTLTATDDGATVTISDNGPGIPAHELEVVESGTETDLQHGSGLGLWVVDWVITNSTATIEYTTTNGEGTTVTVTLPD